MSTTESVQLDKWLWAARFFKVRSLAAKAPRAARSTSAKTAPSRPAPFASATSC